MCRSLWLYEINRRKWTWKFIMKFEWRLGLLLSPSSAKAPWCPRETGEREKKKAYWGLWEENIIANFIGIPSGNLNMRRSGASVQKPMIWSVNFPWNPRRQTLPVLVDAQIPANALFRPIRTKLLYYVTRSHTQVQKNSSQQWRTGVMLQCPISLVSWFVKAVYLLVVHICFNSHCLLFFFLFP